MTEFASLLVELETGDGGLTAESLAGRLGTSRRQVEAMLLALRASGVLGPERDRPDGEGSCASAGSCAGSCPGPEACPFVVQTGATLELRR